MSNEKHSGVNEVLAAAERAGESGVWAQKRRLAAAMRLVIERLVTTEAPVDELRVAADRLALRDAEVRQGADGNW